MEESKAILRIADGRPSADCDETRSDSPPNGMPRRLAFAVADLASMWAAFLVSALLSSRFWADGSAPLFDGNRLGVFIAFTAIAAALLWQQRGRGDSASTGDSLGRPSIVGVTSFASMLAALIGVVIGAQAYSPEFAVALWGLSLVAIPAGGTLMAAGLKLHDGHQGTPVTIVVGANGGSAVVGSVSCVEKKPSVSIEKADSDGKVLKGTIVHGDLESLPDLLHAHGNRNGGVVVAVAADAYAKVKPIVASQSLNGCRLRIALLPPDVNVAGTRDSDALRPSRSSRSYEIAKRWLDVCLSLTSLAFAAPLFAIIAIAIRLGSPGPIFFAQTRVGRGGCLFQMYKFRSMRMDAEDMLEELSERNEASGAMFKISDDPRLTSLGRFIRRLSLDELPQLLNVVQGTMSIVGPRPPLSHEVAEYEAWHFGRFDAVPGITGLWQVCRSNEIDFDQMVRLDLRYIETRSLWRDAAIIVRTIPAMLRGNGAY